MWVKLSPCLAQVLLWLLDKCVSPSPIKGCNSVMTTHFWVFRPEFFRSVDTPFEHNDGSTEHPYTEMFPLLRIEPASHSVLLDVLNPLSSRRGLISRKDAMKYDNNCALCPSN